MVCVIALAAIGAGQAGAATAPGLLNKLATARENDQGYDRDAFEHWATVPGRGCDTRDWVLYRQNMARPRSCGDETGSWLSAYDGVRLTDSSELDVDHMVPLAEAFGSGARNWSADQRKAFANDLFEMSLIAVSASSNRSKSDRDPAEWLPPRRGYVCQYVARWTAVKFRWKLSVDRREKRALRSAFAGCPRTSLRLPNIPRAKVRPSRPEAGGGSADPRFDTCSAANDAGFGPYAKGDEEYEWYVDRDGDGVVCET